MRYLRSYTSPCSLRIIPKDWKFLTIQDYRFKIGMLTLKIKPFEEVDIMCREPQSTVIWHPKTHDILASNRIINKIHPIDFQFYLLARDIALSEVTAQWILWNNNESNIILTRIVEWLAWISRQTFALKTLWWDNLWELSLSNDTSQSYRQPIDNHQHPYAHGVFHPCSFPPFFAG